MILGKINLSDGVVETHNDSYPLTPHMVVSARRPFMLPGFAIGGLVSAFGVAFSDLLFAGEILTIALVATACIVSGLTLAQITFLNRELRGSDLSVVAWGTYPHLNRERREIGNAISAMSMEPRHEHA